MRCSLGVVAVLSMGLTACDSGGKAAVKPKIVRAPCAGLADAVCEHFLLGCEPNAELANKALLLPTECAAALDEAKGILELPAELRMAAASSVLVDALKKAPNVSDGQIRGMMRANTNGLVGGPIGGL